jgi:hypothetical protein
VRALELYWVITEKIQTSTDDTKKLQLMEDPLVKCTRISKGGGRGLSDTNNKMMFNIDLKLVNN